MTVRKFLSQTESTKKRHAPRLVHEYERAVCTAREAGGVLSIREHSPDLARLLSALGSESWLTDRARDAVSAVVQSIETPPETTDPEAVCRGLNRLRHELLLLAGRASADWDFEVCPGDSGSGHRDGDRDREGTTARSRRFSIGVFGESIRSPFNVGSIIRNAEAFGAAFCAFSADSAPPDHPRARRSAMGSAECIPVDVLSLEELSARGWSMFAVELGGEPVSRFVFPESGVAILGNEELGVSERALDLARNSAGIVSVPLYGHKASLNVATASSAVLSWWTAALVERAQGLR